MRCRREPRELKEALEYQTATSEVLSVISRSPSHVLACSQRYRSNRSDLCGADLALFYSLEERYVPFGRSQHILERPL